MTDDAEKYPSKIGVTIPISSELLNDGGLVPESWLAVAMGLAPDPRSEAEKRADRNARNAQNRRIRAEIEAAHAALLAAADPFRRAVLELHAPVFNDYGGHPYCDGCEFGGYEAEPPAHPCRTYSLAADLGLGGR